MVSVKALLVTGGTGSFGQAFIKTILEKHPEVERIVVLSRDEMKQFDMSQRPEFQSRKLRFFIGDVRDLPRLRRAMENIDLVIHAAALKHVPAAEYNPFEVVKTNVLGAQNVIEACMDSTVRQVIALSTDKAVAPVNLYGATKLCSDKLFISANNFKGSRNLRFSVVRYGNVMGSRGSVIPFFLAQAKSAKVLPITDKEMTRFNITIKEAVSFVLSVMDKCQGGEVLVPKIPSFRLLDLAEAVAPGCKYKIVGIRPGEKLHEELLTTMDALYSVELDRYFVLLPNRNIQDVMHYARECGGQMCKRGFRYGSETNTDWLSVEQLRVLIKEHVDPTFRVSGS